MAVLNSSLHTCHYPEGIQQTPPITRRETTIAPIHVGGLGIIFIRCVGMALMELIRCLYMVNALWNGTDRDIWRP